MLQYQSFIMGQHRLTRFCTSLSVRHKVSIGNMFGEDLVIEIVYDSSLKLFPIQTTTKQVCHSFIIM